MTSNDYWVALVELTFSLGGATASPPGRRAAHMTRFSPGALAPARAGRRRGPAAGREADFNATGFTGTAIQAMIEELSQELALKEANFGGYPGNPELLATEAPPPAARAGGPGCGAASLRVCRIPRDHRY